MCRLRFGNRVLLWHWCSFLFRIWCSTMSRWSCRLSCLRVWCLIGFGGLHTCLILPLVALPIVRCLLRLPSGGLADVTMMTILLQIVGFCLSGLFRRWIVREGMLILASYVSLCLSCVSCLARLPGGLSACRLSRRIYLRCIAVSYCCRLRFCSRLRSRWCRLKTDESFCRLDGLADLAILSGC